jgi:hypothetical protein
MRLAKAVDLLISAAQVLPSATGIGNRESEVEERTR